MAVSEWDQRQLCSDDRCIGVIGSEGTCKVCGRAAANWGDERTRGLIAASQGDGDEGDDEYDDDDDDDGEYEDDDDGDAAQSAAPGNAASAGIPAWTTRALCPNGTCIGVIGEDGRCKVCGQSAPAETRLAAPESVVTAAAAADAPAAPGDPLADDREHCADTRCTGLIAADGRCEVCGKGGAS